jgi:hypothetical protein
MFPKNQFIVFGIVFFSFLNQISYVKQTKAESTNSKPTIQIVAIPEVTKVFRDSERPFKLWAETKNFSMVDKITYSRCNWIQETIDGEFIGGDDKITLFGNIDYYPKTEKLGKNIITLKFKPLIGEPLSAEFVFEVVDPIVKITNLPDWEHGPYKPELFKRLIKRLKVPHESLTGSKTENEISYSGEQRWGIEREDSFALKEIKESQREFSTTFELGFGFELASVKSGGGASISQKKSFERSIQRKVGHRISGSRTVSDRTVVGPDRPIRPGELYQLFVCPVVKKRVLSFLAYEDADDNEIPDKDQPVEKTIPVKLPTKVLCIYPHCFFKFSPRHPVTKSRSPKKFYYRGERL